MWVAGTAGCGGQSPAFKREGYSVESDTVMKPAAAATTSHRATEKSTGTAAEVFARSVEGNLATGVHENGSEGRGAVIDARLAGEEDQEGIYF